MTVPDRYPLPNIKDFTANLRGTTIFSTVNLTKAYHQLPMAEEDLFKTALTTIFGLLKFTHMFFVLRNAAQTFQRFMNVVMHGLHFVYWHVDNLL